MVWVSLGITTIVLIGIGAAIQLGLIGGDEPTEAAFTSPSQESTGTATDGTTTETTSTDGTWVIDASRAAWTMPPPPTRGTASRRNSAGSAPTRRSGGPRRSPVSS